MANEQLLASNQLPLEYSTDGGTTWKKIVCLRDSSFKLEVPTTKEETFCGVFTGTGISTFTFDVAGVFKTNPTLATEGSYAELKALAVAKTRFMVREQTPGTGGITATATATVSGGGVSALAITTIGSGYTTEPAITFTGGGGTGAAATATLSNGAVTGYNITAPGTGYTTAPTVAFAAPPATGGVDYTSGSVYITSLSNARTAAPGFVSFTATFTGDGPIDISV